MAARGHVAHGGGVMSGPSIAEWRRLRASVEALVRLWDRYDGSPASIAAEERVASVEREIRDALDATKE